MSTSSSDRTLSLCRIYAKPASEYRVWSLSFFLTSFTRKIHENDHTHHVMSYLPSTGTSARHAHAFYLIANSSISKVEFHRIETSQGMILSGNFNSAKVSFHSGRISVVEWIIL